MRKYLLLLGSLLLVSPLLAQSGLKFGLQISPLVGWSNVINEDDNSSVSDQNGYDFSSRAGFSYGATLSWGLVDNLAILSGVNIVNKGYSRTIAGDEGIFPDSLNLPNGSVAEQSVRMTTVEIPFLLKGRTPEITGGLRIVGKFGVSLDLAVGYRNEYKVLRPDNYATDQVSGTLNGAGDYLRPINISFVVGGGIDWNLPVGTISAGITYHQGLTNMRRFKGFGEGENATIFANEIVRTNYVALDLGFFFL